MSKAKIAVIGTGIIGREHVNFVVDSTSAQLAAIADANPAAASVAAEYGVPFFEDYRQMLDEIEPDGVIAAVPNQLHLEVALAAIERGVPVLIEKPIAATVAEAKQIEAASRAAGVPVLVGHHRRHSPDMVTGRELIRSGGLGKVLAAGGVHYMRKEPGYFEVPWRLQPGVGGPIMINLIHDLDAFRYLIGDIESVSAIAGHEGRELAVEDTAGVVLRFANGAIGTFVLSDAIPSPWVWDIATGQSPSFPYAHGSNYYIGGLEGSLALPGMEHWTHGPGEHWRFPLNRRIVPIDHSGTYPNQLNHFVAMIQEGVPSLCDASEGLATLAAIIAVQRSADEGRTVTVAEVLESEA